ncbi:MAG: o-succinylbenzoate synthase [Streptomycetaceae bacterium]|nr:o-succinylbenzoate synthase [Streptomycetaceae bacterium]
MRIERVSLRMLKARLVEPFSNRWESFRDWTKVVVQVDGDGASGLGECTAMQTPYYSYETIDTAWHILERYLVPLLWTADDHDPRAVTGLWAHVNGHEETKAALECAVWDLHARLAGEPLCSAIGGSVRDVAYGGSVGIVGTIDALVESVAAMHERGNARIRVKIRPGWDLEPVTALRTELPDVPIVVDANAAYTASDVDLFVKMADTGPMAFEQPFSRDHLAANAELQRRVDVPVCLDESVRSLAEARQAIELSACRAMNVKVGRVGGLAEAVRIHDLCRDAGIPTFVGAKYDFGVGRWTNVALATLPNMTWPSDCAPASGYYLDDGVDVRVAATGAGVVRPLDAPGVGVRLTDGLETVREVRFDA